MKFRSTTRYATGTAICMLLFPVSFVSTAMSQRASRAADSRAALEEYMRTTDSEISTMVSEYSRLPKKRITFSANHVLAYGTVIKRVPLDVLLAYADALREADVQRIDVNPSVTSDNDADAVRKYDALVKHIRALGLKLAINPEYEQPNTPGMRFSEFQTSALARYAEWAARYKPDYFVLVHEPTTMSARMHIATTPQQWREFVEATAKVVKQASPSTRIGAGCFAGMSDKDIPFFEEFSRIPELQFLTVDNYVGRPAAIARMEKMTQIAHDVHKPVYMEETWRPHFLPKHLHHKQGASMESESVLGFGDAVFQPVDAKWLHAMSLYAATHGMEAVTAFQTQCFFLYVDRPPFDGPGFKQKVEDAVRREARTETFRAFQQYAREYGAL